MKMFVSLITMTLGLFAGSAIAVENTAQGTQSTMQGEARKEIELTRAQIQTDKKAIVSANLSLTDAENEKFWPAYRNYQDDMAKLSDRSVKLVMDYAQNYNNMTDEFAKNMLNEHLSIQKDKMKLSEKYANKFRKILPEKKVTRLMQIENKMDAVIAADIARSIPLVK